jgi:hypothetical protein
MQRICARERTHLYPNRPAWDIVSFAEVATRTFNLFSSTSSQFMCFFSWKIVSKIKSFKWTQSLLS